MSQKQKIWKGYDELNNNQEFQENKYNEFPEKLPVQQLGQDIEKLNAPRRDFLKFMGFSIGAATIAAGCEMPVRKVIPYLEKPEEITTGTATWYATTYNENGDYCPVLVKTKDGRPIKIEGNPESIISGGGTTARVQASVLDLYDNSRLTGPMQKKEGKWVAGDWNKIDDEVLAKLKKGGKTILLTSSILSPTTKRIIDKFKEEYDAEHVSYDAISASGVLDANEICFGVRTLPDYKLDKADLIVSFNADFLSSWLGSVEYMRDYAKGRKPSKDNPKMTRHVQFEASMSMTGTNADKRIFMKPSEEASALCHIYNYLTGSSISAGEISSELKNSAETIASELKMADNPLVLSGSNNKYIQVLVNLINEAVNTNAVDNTRGVNYRSGSDAAMVQLVADMEAGKIDNLIMWDVNPSYNYFDAESFNKSIAKVGFKISMGAKLDETAQFADYICPDHHYLESWNDAEPKTGSFSLVQPVIAPLFNTRSGADSLMRWTNSLDGDYENYIKNTWSDSIHNASNGLFASFWNKCLHDGVYDMANKSNGNNTINVNIDELESKLNKTALKNEGTELCLYASSDMGDGHRANNPWLQEVPDPVTKVTWDNYILMSKKQADSLGVKQEDVIEVKSGTSSISLPVVLQPGQQINTIGIALGYGRKLAGRIFDNRSGIDGKVRLTTADYLNKGFKEEEVNFTSNWGQNAYPIVQWNGENFIYSTSVTLTPKKGEVVKIAQTQSHHHINATLRPIVREVSLEQYKEDPFAGYSKYADVEVYDKNGELKGIERKLIKSGEEEYLRIKNTRHQNLYYDPTPNLFKGKENKSHAENHGHAQVEEKAQKTAYPGHHWGMNIDLNSCIGCNACVVSCNAENNIPVVGKYEVRRRHDMHWMRIDRYYITEGNADDNHGDDGAANPRVIHQPMLCQHCDNAPCENVCPVAATNHSTEGLNQMAYNRCVGTRYCENNCPYKVRRFNWYDYTGQDSFAWNEAIHDTYRTDRGDDIDDLTKMVLNPDVTIRARGVIEKCSFCVQRIQESKLTAKKESRKLRDGDIKVACQTACPTDCITFGDMNDPNSMVSQKLDDERNFHVIEEVHTLPSIGYLTKVRNVNTKELKA